MSDTSRIAQTFDRLKKLRQMAFMPFLTAGDPDLELTAELIRELARQGADLIEVGFPYSDPIADGPVIQASYTRALNNGLHFSQLFETFHTLTQSGGESLPPLVAMVSFAIVFRHGTERFVEEARTAGFSGLIVPDLPGDEAGEFAETCRKGGLDLIQLVAPTTPALRVERILASASGFIYCISVAGTTGVRQQLPPQLSTQLKELREKTSLPLAVGFGVSRPEQIASLRGLADGVIVGSALVRLLESASENPQLRQHAIQTVGELTAAFASEAHRTAQ